MRQGTAPMRGAIKGITGFVLLITAGFLAASIYRRGFLVVGALMGAVTVLCYLFAPTGYELANGQLVVYSRLRTKTFGPVVRCAILTEQTPGGVRLWGNGGLFALTGIFWNSSYGIFRAYVTSANYRDQVLVETETRKILISPERPEELVKSCPGG